MAPLIRTQFGLNDTQIGLLQGPAFSTLYAFGLLGAGHFIAGRNPYQVAAACVIVWTAGAVLFALAPDYPSMLAARVALGLGQAAFVPAALMLLTAQDDAGRRARALSTFTTGSATGRSAALVLGGAALAMVAGRAVAGLEPWRAACLALALPNLVLIALLVWSGRGHETVVREPGQGLGDAFRLLGRRWRVFAPLLIIGACAVLMIQATAAWSPSILNRSFSLTPAQAALVAGAVALSFAPLGHLGGGWTLGSPVGRRFGAGPLLAAGMALALVSVVALASARGLPMVAAGLAGLTVGGGFTAVIALIEVQALTQPRLRPQVGAVYLAFVSLIGVGLGPLLTGIVSDHGGTGHGALTWAIAAVVSVAAIVGAGVALAFAGRRALDASV